MSRQLNLRVSDEFARKLERVARTTGQPMAAVLESVGTPALDAAEADARFEAEALAAWEEYELSGASVSAAAIGGLFGDAMIRARAPAKRRSR
jgi:predicted transcriptional regulator